ncbi:helix-turn-helix domain-containing protein [Massilibacteroides sp.]|uniref:helix-turn-helix domain-containing protein n=1 Tax=Massilibacteroides sp. TaxID=2034766 RepID=UPI00262EDE14|nr:helix-turn-helix domain-containing protein [Massilibacteroides sp.]MDD4516882.1 helix-turn-helix domain-containing protein [Massilibacteroides sp.]
MEIVNIDSKTFEAMLSTFEGFASRMESLCRLHGDKELSEWLDNQDVCLLLNISPRTLQTFRDNGTLPFSRINHKIYYKSSDVGKITSVVEEKRKQVKYRGKKL